MRIFGVDYKSNFRDFAYRNQNLVTSNSLCNLVVTAVFSTTCNSGPIVCNFVQYERVRQLLFNKLTLSRGLLLLLLSVAEHKVIRVKINTQNMMVSGTFIQDCALDIL